MGGYVERMKQSLVVLSRCRDAFYSKEDSRFGLSVWEVYTGCPNKHSPLSKVPKMVDDIPGPPAWSDIDLDPCLMFQLHGCMHAEEFVDGQVKCMLGRTASRHGWTPSHSRELTVLVNIRTPQQKEHSAVGVDCQ
jgi:hypothetical protein